MTGQSINRVSPDRNARTLTTQRLIRGRSRSARWCSPSHLPYPSGREVRRPKAVPGRSPCDLRRTRGARRTAAVCRSAPCRLCAANVYQLVSMIQFRNNSEVKLLRNIVQAHTYRCQQRLGCVRRFHFKRQRKASWLKRILTIVYELGHLWRLNIFRS